MDGGREGVELLEEGEVVEVFPGGQCTVTPRTNEFRLRTARIAWRDT